MILATGPYPMCSRMTYRLAARGWPRFREARPWRPIPFAAAVLGFVLLFPSVGGRDERCPSQGS